MTYKTRFQYLLDKATDIAQAQSVLNPGNPRLPVLFFVTDPKRISHPEDVAAHLPIGCGIIYRHFGENHALQRAQLLRRIADDHGLILLIGDDDDLAETVSAHGVHLPERNISRAIELRRQHSKWLLTGACHSLDGLKASGVESLNAVVISPVFVSQSPSAAHIESLGLKGVQAFAAVSPVPVYGLGGINCDTIERLRNSGLAGVAAVDAFTLAD